MKRGRSRRSGGFGIGTLALLGGLGYLGYTLLAGGKAQAVDSVDAAGRELVKAMADKARADAAGDPSASLEAQMKISEIVTKFPGIDQQLYRWM